MEDMLMELRDLYDLNYTDFTDDGLVCRPKLAGKCIDAPIEVEGDQRIVCDDDTCTLIAYTPKTKQYLCMANIIVAVCLVAIVLLIGWFRNWFAIIIVLCIIFTMFGFKWMMSKPPVGRRDEGWFDLWTPAHFFRDMVFCFVFFAIFRSIALAIILTIVLSALWELYEHLVLEGSRPNFGGEDLTNKLSDIVVAAIAAFASVPFLVKYLDF